MMKRHSFLAAFMVFGLGILTSLSVPAAEGTPPHLEGSVTYGIAPFDVLSSANDIKINPAQLIAFTGEKSFSALHLYLEAMFIYEKTTASVNYNYTTTVNYQAQNANATLDIFGAGFGLRFKFFDRAAFTPFVEVGGVGSYMQFTYDNSIRTQANMNLGSDFKSQDAVLDFGSYVQGGIELDLTKSSGIQVSDRYLDSNTRPIVTMKSEMVHYVANYYMFTLFSHF